MDTAMRLLAGILLGLILASLALLAWLRFGQPPVAVADTPLPVERYLAPIALSARIAREAPKTAPILADEANLLAGAQIYRDQCALCHGFRGKPAALGAHLYPAAQPLWEQQASGQPATLGVSADTPGETYWKIVNGIRLTGMPAYKGVLTDAELWQVSLLLASADKPLPPEVIGILCNQDAASPAQSPMH